MTMMKHLNNMAQGYLHRDLKPGITNSHVAQDLDRLSCAIDINHIFMISKGRKNMLLLQSVNFTSQHTCCCEYDCWLCMSVCSLVSLRFCVFPITIYAEFGGNRGSLKRVSCTWNCDQHNKTPGPHQEGPHCMWPPVSPPWHLKIVRLSHPFDLHYLHYCLRDKCLPQCVPHDIWDPLSLQISSEAGAAAHTGLQTAFCSTLI